MIGRLAALAVGAVVTLVPPAVDIKVTPVVADGQVSVSFVAPAAVTTDLRELVESGLLMTLSFTVDLKEPSAAWFDRSLARVVVASSVKYDNLTGVYHVSRMRDDHVFWSERTSEFAEASAQLTTFDRVPLTTDDRLQPNAEYYILVRMRSSPKRTFPLWPWSSDDGSGRGSFTYLR